MRGPACDSVDMETSTTAASLTFPESFRGETRFIRRGPSTYAVRAIRILGTDRVVVDAWEPSAWAGPHSSICSDIGGDAGVWGKIRARRLPASLAGMPTDTADALDRRVRAVRAFQALNDIEAEALILEAFPGADVGGGEGRGRIAR